MFEALGVRFLCWLTRNFHNLPGRWRIVGWLKNHESVVRRLAPATIRLGHGFRMHADPAEFGGMHLFISGSKHNERLVRIMRAVVRPGDCVIDVGANIGYFTLLFSRLVGPAGQVHAFEPSAQIVDILKRNLSLNNASNILLHEKAASDHCGQVMFNTAVASHLGWSSMRALGDKVASAAMVKATPIDAELAAETAVRLVKIDVEGAEFLVLQGMKQLVQRDKPYIILELTDNYLRQLGSSASEVLTWFHGHGYSLYEVMDDGVRPVEEPTAAQCDLFAVHAQAVVPESVAIVDAVQSSHVHRVGRSGP